MLVVNSVLSGDIYHNRVVLLEKEIGASCHSPLRQYIERLISWISKGMFFTDSRLDRLNRHIQFLSSLIDSTVPENDLNRLNSICQRMQVIYGQVKQLTIKQKNLDKLFNISTELENVTERVNVLQKRILWKVEPKQIMARDSSGSVFSDPILVVEKMNPSSESPLSINAMEAKKMQAASATVFTSESKNSSLIPDVTEEMQNRKSEEINPGAVDKDSVGEKTNPLAPSVTILKERNEKKNNGDTRVASKSYVVEEPEEKIGDFLGATAKTNKQALQSDFVQTEFSDMPMDPLQTTKRNSKSSVNSFDIFNKSSFSDSCPAFDPGNFRPKLEFSIPNSGSKEIKDLLRLT